ncbi:hypothetical protein H1P_4590007 [Hyella patelloides LEGE 07179]|uniref:Uncharacterized protein n=1 Tax=Hyella patelloides LEGE 07179 TaxID=945734 RepID=A0A563VYM9_9CYAN|nr:hypothetical protein H1P_4590007 [Hyella patelloides LEGE 07179]
MHLPLVVYKIENTKRKIAIAFILADETIAFPQKKSRLKS